MHLLFVWLLSLATYQKVSMVNSKPTIDYNNILIKAQFINIVAVNDNEIHSKRSACVKDSDKYYIVFALSS